MKIPNAIIKEVEILRDANVYKGSFGSRIDKLYVLHRAMNRFYGKKIHLFVNMYVSKKLWIDSGGSFYNPSRQTILLNGRISVLTFLHEWGHVLYGSSEEKANEFARTIFKQVFPKQYEKLKTQGRMLVKGDGNDA